VTLYSYRCPVCGSFDSSFPIGTAPDRVGCPECSTPSARQFTAPRIGHGSSGYGRAIERAESSADQPRVVTGQLPGAARRPVRMTRNPLHAKLPRP
jgi:putative FmdB family regulatory protein